MVESKTEEKQIVDWETPIHVDASNFEENFVKISLSQGPCHPDNFRNDFIDTLLTDSGFFKPGEAFINIAFKDRQNGCQGNHSPLYVNTQAASASAQSEAVQAMPRDLTDEELEYDEIGQTITLTDPFDNNLHYDVDTKLLSSFLKTNGRQINRRKRKSKEHIRWLDSFWSKKKKC